jgi:hypothetical protein
MSPNRSRQSRRPLASLIAPPAGSSAAATPQARCDETLSAAGAELFVWFEDNRRPPGGRAAGFPECLLPYGKGMRVLERRYADGHPHLLAAVRIRCDDRVGERVASLYTAALALGTIAWIGTGASYRRAWAQLYPPSRAPLE